VPVVYTPSHSKHDLGKDIQPVPHRKASKRLG
jgi:hypothetical protein